MKIPHLICPNCLQMKFYISIVNQILTFTCANCKFETLVEGQTFKATGIHMVIEDGKENKST